MASLLSSSDARAELKTAQKEREALEAEAEAIEAELTSPSAETGAAGPGLSGPLVDGEGYPRADIDVYRARQLRHRHACLRTDHKALMKRIEALLPLAPHVALRQPLWHGLPAFHLQRQPLQLAG